VGDEVAFTQQVELLLGQARRTGIYYSNMSMMKGVVDPRAHVGHSGPGTYVANGEVQLISEPASLLQRLYAAAGPSHRQSFVPTLLRSLNMENARVIARTLAATGNLDALAKVTGGGELTQELWRGLVHTLRFESSLFSEADLQSIETAAVLLANIATQEGIKENQSNPHRTTHRLVATGSTPYNPKTRTYRLVTPMHDVLDELRSVIERVRYLRLAKTIQEGQNPAIDHDRQVLLSRLQSMGFSDKLSIASSEIEKRAASASTGVDVESAMDLLRTFFEEFTEEACRKIEAKVGKPVPTGPKVAHYQPYRQYLENAGIVGPEESALLQTLYNFLSNQGTHKLGSAPEQLRVAHATVIEWCMLIAGRASDFLQNP